jgi:TM2 domain-containing membrane protein YozV
VTTALLNTVVFPGVGQFVDKQYIRATIYALMSLLALIVLLGQLSGLVSVILEQIQALSTPPSFQETLLLVNQTLNNQDTAAVKIATMGLVIAWALSMIDTFIMPTTTQQTSSDK